MIKLSNKDLKSRMFWKEMSDGVYFRWSGFLLDSLIENIEFEYDEHADKYYASKDQLLPFVLISFQMATSFQLEEIFQGLAADPSALAEPNEVEEMDVVEALQLYNGPDFDSVESFYDFVFNKEKDYASSLHKELMSELGTLGILLYKTVSQIYTNQKKEKSDPQLRNNAIEILHSMSNISQDISTLNEMIHMREAYFQSYSEDTDEFLTHVDDIVSNLLKMKD